MSTYRRVVPDRIVFHPVGFAAVYAAVRRWTSYDFTPVLSSVADHLIRTFDDVANMGILLKAGPAGEVRSPYIRNIEGNSKLNESWLPPAATIRPSRRIPTASARSVCELKSTTLKPDDVVPKSGSRIPPLVSRVST